MADDNGTSTEWVEASGDFQQEHDGGGEESGGEPLEGGSNSGDDTSGAGNDTEATAGDVQRSDGFTGVQVGSGEGSGTVDESQEDGAEVGQAVTLQAVEEIHQDVNQRLDALNACAVVVVFALFICAGAVVVQTFVRSLEWKN